MRRYLRCQKANESGSHKGKLIRDIQAYHPLSRNGCLVFSGQLLAMRFFHHKNYVCPFDNFSVKRVVGGRTAQSSSTHAVSRRPTPSMPCATNRNIIRVVGTGRRLLFPRYEKGP